MHWSTRILNIDLDYPVGRNGWVKETSPENHRSKRGRDVGNRYKLNQLKPQVHCY